MDYADIAKYADIKPDGSILLGQHTVCDGANYGRRVGVFTHIHHDHIGLLNKAMHDSSVLYATKPTLDMLAVLEQGAFTIPAERYFKGRQIHALDYGSPTRPKLDRFSENPGEGDTITLYPSHHILGSCQVLVETKDGMNLAYTGDFGRNADPIQCDVLVLDSTHGGPMFDARADHEDLERVLVEHALEEIRCSKNILIRAHRGRLQHTMHLLSQALPEDVRFLAHPTDISLVPVYGRHGLDIRNCTSYKSEAGMDVRDGGSQYVEFRTHGPIPDTLKGRDRMAVFNLGGKFLGGNTVVRKNGEYYIEFMDHADYGSIIEYVRAAGPKYVVTDNIRGKQGKRLAEAIEKELGIRAVARP